MSVPAIILAAGASRRFGRPKQLVEFFGESLLRRTILSVLAGCAPIFVVLGSQANRIATTLDELPVTVVINESWQEGIASSIRAGVQALPANVDGVFIFVCDQTALDSLLVLRLLEVQSCNPGFVLASEYAGIRGTPAYFPAKYFYRLEGLKGDSGAGRLLRDNSVITVPFLNGDFDIDYPEDLEKY